MFGRKRKLQKVHKKFRRRQGFMLLEVLVETLLLGILVLGVIYTYQSVLTSWLRVRGLQKAVTAAEHYLADVNSLELQDGLVVQQGSGKYGEIKVLKGGQVIYNLFGKNGE